MLNKNSSFFFGEIILCMLGTVGVKFGYQYSSVAARQSHFAR